jgi:hypothetical protein
LCLKDIEGMSNTIGGGFDAILIDGEREHSGRRAGAVLANNMLLRQPGTWHLKKFRIVAIGMIMNVFLLSASYAQAPAREGCRAASKIEYDSAKATHLLRNRFGMYVRTGRFWQRHYWYCHYA